MIVTENWISEVRQVQPRTADWLEAQSRLDWQSGGLPAFSDWDPAVLATVRLLAVSPVPMVIMIGRQGIVLGNAQAQFLFLETTGEGANGQSVFTLLPDSVPFYTRVLREVFSGRSLNFNDQVIRLIQEGKPIVRSFNLHFVPVIGAGGQVVAALGTASDVTRYVERTRNLSESEQRLRLALEGWGLIGIMTLDVETGLSTTDAKVAELYGLPVAECERGIARARFLNAIHPDDREKASSALTEAIETGTAFRCRYRIVSDSGAVRWVVVSGKPSWDDDGKLARILGAVVDVTGEVETASALAESRFRFQTLTETLPQIVWSSLPDGRHDYFSKRWREFTGIAPEDITEDTWKTLVHPDDLPMVLASWISSRATGAPYDIEYRFRHWSGEYRWLRVMALPMRDDDGKVVRWFGTSTDIHESYLFAQERERLANEMERIAAEDQLTKVLTRRAFMARSGDIIEQAAGGRRSASLLMLDIDHFKSINDTFGHPGGDKVLAVAATRIKASVKGKDIVGRLGGEEFAVLLPCCSERQAQRVAERIRRAMQDEPIAVVPDRNVSVTVSIGITTTTSSPQTLDQLLGRADKALYEAKSAGRNRVIFAACA